MIYWSDSKKGLVFYFENQATLLPTKVWLTKDGWHSDNATPELIEECEFLLLEIKHFWLKKFSYSLVKDKVAAILEPYLRRFKKSTELGEKLMLAAYICNEGKNACIREISLTDPTSALCLFFYKGESWKEFTSNLI